MAGQLNSPAFDYYLRLKRVQKYVEEHYQEAVSLKSAAGIACMEAKSFSKFFHKKVGITFKAYLTQKRIIEAMELMRSSDDSITEIALSVGFADLRTFERAFKKVNHMLPREFRTSVCPNGSVLKRDSPDS